MINEHLQKYINDINTHFDSTKSITDILNSFRCVSENFQKSFIDINTFNYSSYNYAECPGYEQEIFEDDILNNIQTLVIGSIYEKTGQIWGWKSIYDLLLNDVYAKTDKQNRKVVYPTSNIERPIGDKSYNMWNGLQIIDLDVKDANMCDILKPIIFENLCKYNWFLGVCKSASGKGLHVWTKITPISLEFNKRKIEYICNFRHKYSYVYIILTKYMEQYGYTKNNIYKWMDMAMAKPQQGIFISSDKTALLNMNFRDLRLDVNFESALNTGVETINWITHPDLKEIFTKLEWFNNDNFDENVNVVVKTGGDLNNRKSTGIRKHYKHAQRWQLANTLTNLYGEDQALAIMLEICKGTDKRELKGDVKTAAIHNKPISVWAVTELNKEHGFDIKIDNTNELNNKSNQLNNIDITKEDITKVVNKFSNKVVLNINKNQYLSDIKNDILNNLSHITLLEAGAGYGKTEMIKAFKGKTLLVLPFTSTIKAKIEKSETTSDWLYYYGNKKPTLNELLGEKSMSMTIDKFSNLNVMEVDTAGFEYIVIDESHLLFTSSYRDVMSPAIQRIANCKAKIILMTGTPTGELIFFPGITHIKVIKEEIREKNFDVILCQTPSEQFIEMCKSMANDIMNGKKILFPTNRGNLYFEQVTGLINQILQDNNFERGCNAFYYKKSNFGEQSMDDINYDKTIGNNDIIFCTTYLSVGVDICDRCDFNVYFAQTFISQDVEQFANRLRNNNLYIKLFLSTTDEEGNILSGLFNEKPLDLNFKEEELVFARDMCKTCNDMLERNNEESKYNPVLLSILGSNRYLKYDENDCKYYIDETTFKLKLYEERYEEYAKQLPILMKAMQEFGYNTHTQTIESHITEDRIDRLKEYLKDCRNIRFNKITQQTKEFLSHITENNIEWYKEINQGNYDILKGDKYEEVRGENNLYVKDIEILEKNIPIILSLYNYFTCDTIKEIYDHCIDKKTNRLNFSKLGRIKTFAIIYNNIKRERVDFPIYKFIAEVRKWVLDHPQTTKHDIENFIGGWAAKYCNMIKNVVIDDIMYLETMNEHMMHLFDCITLKSKPKNGNITITPFELLWETKDELNNLYGGSINTKIFFEDILDQLKPINVSENVLDNVNTNELDDLPHTDKLKLDDIKNEIKNIVHDNYDYNIYSELDKSNDRFIRKQENTSRLNNAIINIEEDKQNDNDEIIIPDLFSSLEEEF